MIQKSFVITECVVHLLSFLVMSSTLHIFFAKCGIIKYKPRKEKAADKQNIQINHINL